MRPYIHALALGLDPAWRRLPPPDRIATGEAFAAALRELGALADPAARSKGPAMLLCEVEPGNVKGIGRVGL